MCDKREVTLTKWGIMRNEIKCVFQLYLYHCMRYVLFVGYWDIIRMLKMVSCLKMTCIQF